MLMLSQLAGFGGQRAPDPFVTGTWSGSGGSGPRGAEAYIGIRFVAPATGNLTQVKLNVGGPAAGTVTAYLYSDDGASPGHPSTLLATSSNTQSSGVTGDKTFIFAAAPVASGTKYWIVFGGLSGSVNITTVASAAGYESARGGTVGTLASNGFPESSSEDWKVEISGEA